MGCRLVERRQGLGLLLRDTSALEPGIEPPVCTRWLTGRVLISGERPEGAGVQREAAGEGEGSAAAQEPGEPPQGGERGGQEALPGERR